ncbi:head protein [Plesiomonas shigelloides]|uniref:head completion/stabilization protein n=1 Tax=Plesiomonas shigelloides TaxID=703 RepID=UPI00126167C3|nr:head completion/stabilization protein [Plesiomonas shigelloides]KAB7715713.1 head protein [Plesiomonas shigelloides]
MFDGKSIHYQQATIQNDGFWPDINAGDFERTRTIPPTIDHSVVINALLTSVAEINMTLVNARQRYIEQGFSRAQDVTGVVAVMDEDNTTRRNHLTALYTKAVYARAKADLLPEFAVIGRRDTHPAQEAPEVRRGLLAESAMALRAILQLPRCSISLID